MEFRLWASLKDCFHLYFKNFAPLFFVSVLMSFSELVFLSLFHHGYIFFRYQNFLSLSILFFTEIFILGVSIYFHHSLIRGARNLFVDKTLVFFERNFYHAKNQCLQGALVNLSVFLVLSVPIAIYILTVRYVETFSTRLILGTFLLFVILGFGHNYKLAQVSCVLESKKISHLKMSMALIRNKYKHSFIYFCLFSYWTVVAFHLWTVMENGHPHICGCNGFIQIMTILWTVFRPFWILFQVKFYLCLRKKLFPVPEMEPELMDRNLI